MSKQPDTDGAIRAMRAVRHGPRVKSPAYKWLAARHDTLASAFRESQPAWKALAKYLGDGGVMGAKGVPLTGGALRATWVRVVEDKKRQSRDEKPVARSRGVAWSPSDRTGDDGGPEIDFDVLVKVPK